MLAYCCRSGHIGFGSGKVPSGTLPLVRDRSKMLVKMIVSGAARHAYDGETLLVPGIPEAKDEDEALSAYARFRDRVTINLAGARERRGAA